MITFKKVKYDDVPEDIRKLVLNFSDNEVQIDDSKNTRIEMKKLLDWMSENGYKEI